MKRIGLIDFFFAGLSINAQNESALRLWYKKPASNWDKALPAGNGRLGTMVFGHPTFERIQLNEGSLWAGARFDQNNPKAGIGIGEIQHLLLNGEHEKAYKISEEGLFKAGGVNYFRERDASVVLAGTSEIMMYGQVVDIPNAWQGPGGGQMKFYTLLKAIVGSIINCDV